jgi:hypothetical protein
VSGLFWSMKEIFWGRVLGNQPGKWSSTDSWSSSLTTASIVLVQVAEEAKAFVMTLLD